MRLIKQRRGLGTCPAVTAAAHPPPPPALGVAESSGGPWCDAAGRAPCRRGRGGQGAAGGDAVPQNREVSTQLPAVANLLPLWHQPTPAAVAQCCCRSFRIACACNWLSVIHHSALPQVVAAPGHCPLPGALCAVGIMGAGAAVAGGQPALVHGAAHHHRAAGGAREGRGNICTFVCAECLCSCRMDAGWQAVLLAAAPAAVAGAFHNC